MLFCFACNLKLRRNHAVIFSRSSSHKILFVFSSWDCALVAYLKKSLCHIERWCNAKLRSKINKVYLVVNEVESWDVYLIHLLCSARCKCYFPNKSVEDSCLIWPGSINLPGFKVTSYMRFDKADTGGGVTHTIRSRTAGSDKTWAKFCTE